MMRLLIALLFFLIFSGSVTAQNHEFIGLLKFGTTQMISYRIVFTEKDGKINGYSVTDLQGVNETKNRIEGTYNKSTKEFSFSEKEIDYTKSKISQKDFCYVHFSGKLKLTDKSTLKGDFKGLFKDNSACVNGSLQLIGSVKAYDRMNKWNNKVQKSKKIDPADKEKVNLNKMLDSLKVNTLRKDEVVSAFINKDKAELVIWDDSAEDGDLVAVYVDDKEVLKSYELKTEKKVIPVQLVNNEATVKLVALNSGSIPPNTGRFKIKDGTKEIEFVSILSKNDVTIIKIIKKPQ